MNHCADKPEGRVTAGNGWQAYHRKVEQITRCWPSQGRVSLRKKSSNLFRLRKKAEVRLDMSQLTSVIAIYPEQMEADVEGMITYEDLVAALEPGGWLPAVVPELKTITLGGAIAGGGIESSSFRFGFVHETVAEMDILTAAGEVVTARPGGEHDELFRGFPCTYGTLGYVLRARIRLVPIKGDLRLEHVRLSDTLALLPLLEELCHSGRMEGSPDYIEGVVFGPDDAVLSTATFIGKTAAYRSDYSGQHIYYKSLLERERDYLAPSDYIWRWDTDWFWCARAFGVEIPLVRRILGLMGLLRSGFYWQLRSLLARIGVLNLLQLHRPQEWVIQDVEIPIERSAEFVRFFIREIGLFPFWVCPAQSPRDRDPQRYPFTGYSTDPESLYLNFGFWGGVDRGDSPSHYNRLIERKVTELGGKKSLYSEAFYSRQEFDSIYGGETYKQLKQRYDPDGRYGDLFDKVVG